MLRKPLLGQDLAGIEVHLGQRDMMPALPQGLQERHRERPFGQRAEGIDPVGGRLGIAATADHRHGHPDRLHVLGIGQHGAFQDVVGGQRLVRERQVERRSAVATVKEDQRPASRVLRQQRKQFGVEQVARRREIARHNGFGQGECRSRVFGLDTVAAEMDPQLVARLLQKTAQSAEDIGFGRPRRRRGHVVAQKHDVFAGVVVGIHQHVDDIDDVVDASAQGVGMVGVVASDQQGGFDDHVGSDGGFQ